MAEAAHLSCLRPRRADDEPAVGLPRGLVPRHHEVGVSADELDVDLQLKPGHTVRRGVRPGEGCSPRGRRSSTEYSI